MDHNTFFFRCILDDIGIKLFSIISSINFMDLQCIKEYQIPMVVCPMVVAQSLISNIKIHCVGASGVKRRSYQILNNYVRKALPLCTLTRLVLSPYTCIGIGTG